MERVEDPAPGLVDYSLSHLAIAALCSREVMCGNNWRTSFRPLNLQIALRVQSSTEFIRSRAHGKKGKNSSMWSCQVSSVIIELQQIIVAVTAIVLASLAEE